MPSWAPVSRFLAKKRMGASALMKDRKLGHGACCQQICLNTLWACGLNHIHRIPTVPESTRTSAFVRGGLVCYEATSSKLHKQEKVTCLLRGHIRRPNKKKIHVSNCTFVHRGVLGTAARNMRQARRSVLVALFVLVVVALCSNSVSASPVTRKLDCS